MDRRDATGLSCRRSGQYDATSGQFTQTDPIGIAGGLNTYGYAGGDPINFSDPFGLCDDPNDPACKLWFGGVGGAVTIPFLNVGVNVGLGVTYREGDGLGYYITPGVVYGHDISVHAEGGVSNSQTDFEGLALEGCGGALSFSGCVAGGGNEAMNLEPKTVTVENSIWGTPVNATGGVTQTLHMNFKDLKNAGRDLAWLVRGLFSIINDEGGNR